MTEDEPKQVTDLVEFSAKRNKAKRAILDKAIIARAAHLSINDEDKDTEEKTPK